MGVTQLWQILAPVEQHMPLTSLEGQTLAVDLSIWVCENQCVKQMQGVVTRPYLRNLFFRIFHLTQLGVKLVFVIEGSAPELKWDTMLKRQQSRFPGRQGKQAQQRPAGKQTRRNFNCWLKECCELLEILGIPYIQSRGEAEALCALLNAAGLVDGCLTNDGDAFLYGATTVYRNFTMNAKDPHVEMYRLSDIQEKLGIDRGGLIALGLLIGCDFVPKGVPGIGIANAVRLLQSLQGQDILIRLQSWSTMSERDCIDQAEVLARRKAIQVPDFPQIKVIDEFLVAKDRCPSRLPEWKRPVPVKLQEFAQIKLEWPIEYTMEKVLPLITLWDMQDLLNSKNPSVHQHLKPFRIVRSRVRQGESCFEVEWIKPVTDTALDGSYYVTVESQDLFTKCYPDMAKVFITQTTEQKKKPKAKKKKKKVDNSASAPLSLDNLSFQFEKVNLGQVTSWLQESAKDLHPSFTEYDETALTKKAKQPRHLTLSPNSKKSNSKGEKLENRKSTALTSSGSREVDARSIRDTDEETVVPLSQRVKLRLQNKHGNNKENEDKLDRGLSKGTANEQKINLVKSPGGDLSTMGSLLEDIQNLSLKEQENFRQTTKQKHPLSSKFLCDVFSNSVTSKHTPTSLSRKFSSAKEKHKMSSPAAETFCSPMTYMKHQGELGDSFEIQRSPYYIENPWAASKSKSEKNMIDISSPGFFSRLDVKKEPEEVDNRSAAEKLAEKLESGINQIGSGRSIHVDSISSTKKVASNCKSDGENLTVDSLMSVLRSSEKKSDTQQQVCNRNISTPSNQSAAGLDSSSLSQFGDFQIQHSLLNSLCSSLVQALTPKGVAMNKEEYDKLLTSLNALESEDDEVIDKDDIDGSAKQDDLVCNIDFSELEKASKSFKNLNQKLLLRPIQIDDIDVMSKLTKSARKKLRRRERKREQELINQAHVQNKSQLKGKSSNCVEKQAKKNNSNSRNNSEKRTKNENAITTDIDLNKSKKAKGKGVCTVLERKSAEKVKSDQQALAIAEVKKPENAGVVNIQHASMDNAKSIESQSEIVVEKVKKKKKKKKAKKASPMIDISTDDKVGSCAEYLKKALENNQRKSAEKKIIKASPFMDFLADDTLLELEELSCKIAGEEVTAKVNSKLKKKILSKEKMSKEEETKLNALPVLVNSDISKSEKSQEFKCGKQNMIEDNETDDEELERNSDWVSENKLDKFKNSSIDVADTSVRASYTRSVLDNCAKQDSDNLTFVKGTEFVTAENENVVGIHLNKNMAAEEEKECTEDSHGNGYGSSADEQRNEITKGYYENEHVDDIPSLELDIEPEAEHNTSVIKDEDFVAEYNTNVKCAEAFEDLMIYNKSANKNGAENESLESDKTIKETNLFESEICFVKTETQVIKEQNRFVDVIEIESLDDSLEQARKELDCYDSILSKCNELKSFDNDLPIDNGIGGEIKEVIVETDLDASNSGGANCYGSFKKYHIKPVAERHEPDKDHTKRNADLHAPCKNTGCMFTEVSDQGVHDTLVLKSENAIDKNVEYCKFPQKLDTNHGSNGISCHAECISETKVDHSNADNSMPEGISITNICINGKDECYFIHEMESKAAVESKNCNKEGLVDVSLSSDVRETNALMIDEYETKQSTMETRDDKDTCKIDITTPEVFQSPACLADRLKMKLRKASTRSVLDAFTNGK